MPLYEYLCHGCKRRVEVIQKFDDEELSRCSQCGGRLERLISSPAIQFKGSGWYITDYARKPSAENGGKSADSKPTDTSSEPAKKEPAAQETSSTKDTPTKSE